MKHITPYIIAILFCFIHLLVGCDGDNIPQTSHSISFSSQTSENLSRASFINSTTDIDHFLVWGNYDGNEVFNGQRVERKNYVWEYSPVKSWILSAEQYDFSAYLPAEAGMPRIINNQLTTIEFDCNTIQTDLMMAYTIVPKTNIGRTVEMNFKHALAAINFSFKLKEGLSYTHIYKVLDIRWGDVYTKGNFTLNNNNTITPAATDVLRETTRLKFTGTQITNTQAMESEYLFVIPQTQQNAKLIFTLETNGESQEITKTVSDIQWEAGMKYTYSVTVDPFEITVETTPWEKPNIKNIIIQ